MTTQYIRKDNDGTFYFKDPEMKIPHREDGPAFEHTSGTKMWYLNGQCHREDGPAIECPNGTKSWFLNDELLTEAEFNARMNPVVELTFDEIANKLGINVKNLKIKK